MHALTVIDHRSQASFSATAARSFMDGAEAAGHTAELADLHTEGFDPRWSMADVDFDSTGIMPSDVRRERARIARDDAICLVISQYWCGMPAMTKGWVDHVWFYGWAFDDVSAAEKSLQRATIASASRPAQLRRPLQRKRRRQHTA